MVIISDSKCELHRLISIYQILWFTLMSNIWIYILKASFWNHCKLVFTTAIRLKSIGRKFNLRKGQKGNQHGIFVLWLHIFILAQSHSYLFIDEIQRMTKDLFLLARRNNSESYLCLQNLLHSISEETWVAAWWTLDATLFVNICCFHVYWKLNHCIWILVYQVFPFVIK